MNVENCERCHKPTNGMTIMSMFNTQIICMKCKGAERQRPDYNDAVAADVAEIKKGNLNFEGIGLKEGGSNPSPFAALHSPYCTNQNPKP